MIKKCIAKIKLELIGGNATPMPPLGPALGQYGIDISLFCKEYNLKTINEKNKIIPVEIFIYNDKSFIFTLKTSPTSKLLLKAANLKKGSSVPNKIIVGYISEKQLQEIIYIKLRDLNTNCVKKARKIILGTLFNLGIHVYN